jgi:hypothetical protein
VRSPRQSPGCSRPRSPMSDDRTQFLAGERLRLRPLACRAAAPAGDPGEGVTRG